ncbi:MAG: hypothetical protein H6Q30_3102 [Bacteroidetes bacterium]|nr:hypothetical protein [Bacteroidota bacterium]
MRLMAASLAMVFLNFGVCMSTVAGERMLNVVVVTGGHEFDAKTFPTVFAGYSDLKVTFADQKEQSELFEDISHWSYDVIVFYNMGQKISEKRRANLLALLNKGVGVVGMHHSIAAYAPWPEWPRIIGGRYFEKEAEFDGKQHRASTYLHDVPLDVVVADSAHPITAGVRNFHIVDETYKYQWLDPQSHLLLTTDEATSDRALAWARTYGNARVCYIQLGHGPTAYNDPNFRRLVVQAIRWAAK